MDNRAGEMEVFVAAAELKSFSAAGRRLRLSPSAVSKLVTRIEDRLGTRLLVRTTRSLLLTPEGEVYLGRAQRILAEIAETEELVAGGGRATPRGLLRVNSTIGFGERYIVPLAGEFLARYPEVRLDLSLSDGIIDLIEERTDIAFRTAPMRDSSLMARKLLESHRITVATPDYLARRGTPKHPDDLANHNCITFTFGRNPGEWPFRDPQSRSVFSRPAPGNAQASSGSIARTLCLTGLGIARIGKFHVEPDLEKGTLVEVLEDYNPQDPEQVHAVFAGHEHLAARIRAFIDFLAEKME
ncbi:LysR family transcriptional regulator [Pararhizobium polonicum]|uniref:HTH-type transcriptional regulator TtuA n=1 Tax=Pararhizobium polonicum TaxID=1612624 RepID=A0A1C7P3U4_9HYPH|nr:LysR family transcriptional regulator [Pararhizobium polonicum]OBZ95945.1 LysR family transcriptional regulator [Pararhizobium polonicum]